jgi:hypothetical protein
MMEEEVENKMENSNGGQQMGATTVSIMTLIITTLGITTLSIYCHCAECLVFHYYGECCYDKCHYVACCLDKCHYAECYGTVLYSNNLGNLGDQAQQVPRFQVKLVTKKIQVTQCYKTFCVLIY